MDGWMDRGGIESWGKDRVLLLIFSGCFTFSFLDLVFY